MEIIEPGHIYRLAYLDEKPGALYQSEATLVFVNREPGHEHPGTQTQEVLRALIDRTFHCDNCLPNDLNALIIHHLRMAIVFHEMRALQRKAEKGRIDVENVALGLDGHWRFDQGVSDRGDVVNAAPRREFEYPD